MCLLPERRRKPAMQAAARFRAMKAVGTVVAPTDTVLAQFFKPHHNRAGPH